ncbi:unnamed protein product [Pleuronectes platessa]|uniref:Uncharacterized protein n=1 Tax=Pleuronectes platessa TaxID=8262 RepID=A0A9N7VFW9_PLEPL|nr:unnamed protein product [Pleuronectes platessa]
MEGCSSDERLRSAREEKDVIFSDDQGPTSPQVAYTSHIIWFRIQPPLPSSAHLSCSLLVFMDSFTPDCPGLMKHPCLAYLPIGAIIFTPLCAHQHKRYLLTMAPSLLPTRSALASGSSVGRVVSEVKPGPTEPWEAVMAKAQTQTRQVCQSDSFR